MITHPIIMDNIITVQSEQIDTLRFDKYVSFLNLFSFCYIWIFCANFVPRLALKANIAATKIIKAVSQFTVSYN